MYVLWKERLPCWFLWNRLIVGFCQRSGSQSEGWSGDKYSRIFILRQVASPSLCLSTPRGIIDKELGGHCPQDRFYMHQAPFVIMVVFSQRRAGPELDALPIELPQPPAREEKMLVIFERKVLRINFGGINDSRNWRRRYNFELFKLFRDVDVLKSIKLNWIRGVDHIMRMERDRAALKIFDTVSFGHDQGVDQKRDRSTVWNPILVLFR